MVKNALSKLTGNNLSDEEFLLAGTDFASELDGNGWFSDSQEGQLAVDVYQTEKDIVVKAPVAGVDESDIDIEVRSDQITIRGERKEEKEVSEGNYHTRECFWGAFSRVATFPVEGDPEKAKATFKNGILTVRVPKSAKHQARKIKVNE